MDADPLNERGRHTAWQLGRRRRRALVDRAIGLFFGLLALTSVLYILALMDLVRPVF